MFSRYAFLNHDSIDSKLAAHCCWKVKAHLCVLGYISNASLTLWRIYAEWV